ncbi:hypothetical protein [uncultured Alistipes sp.]|nr:hypothetical protein [uncultured Alistipes sp.]
MITAVVGVMALLCGSCGKELVSYRKDDLKITIEAGREWLHDFPLLMGIKKKNPPQIAVWVEDPAGNYISTIYVTHKIATQSWTASGGNRRRESLPVWCHARGVRYGDGLYLPTRKEPLTDGISGATPQESFDVKITPAGNLRQFIVKIEINHSTDWNAHYPKSAPEGAPNYSGGKGGSGQPAVVYAAEVDLDSGQTLFEAALIGHSSPDGSDGGIYPDLTGLTSSLDIVKRITVGIK